MWPGLFLLVGGATKAADSTHGRGTVVLRALPARVPEAAAWWTLAALELGAGALVLATLATPFAQLAAALLLAVATAVAAWGVRNASDASCGCLGASRPIDAGTPLRAAALAALALCGALAARPWTAVFDDAAATALWLAVGAALAAATPELRGGRPLAEALCARRWVSLERTLTRLRASELWRGAREHLAAEAPSEHWREGCWRYLSYPARYDGRRATAVFALYLGGGRSRADAVAFVDEAGGQVLGELRMRPR